MQLVGRRVRSGESPASALCVFAFNAGFLWDHVNGAFLGLWHVLGWAGVGACDNLFQGSVGLCASMAAKNGANELILPCALVSSVEE